MSKFSYTILIIGFSLWPVDCDVGEGEGDHCILKRAVRTSRTKYSKQTADYGPALTHLVQLDVTSALAVYQIIKGDRGAFCWRISKQLATAMHPGLAVCEDRRRGMAGMQAATNPTVHEAFAGQSSV